MNVKFTTGERMGFVGRGEGMAALARRGGALSRNALARRRWRRNRQYERPPG